MGTIVVLRSAAADVTDPTALDALIRGADVVLNCVGPFYRFGPPTLAAAIAAGVGYVDICHIHGGEPSEGAAVLKHRIHAMVNDVPLFIDGRQIAVRQLEESAAPYVRQIDFAGVGTYPVYPYPHPETITLPATFPTLRRATNLGVVFPLPYFEMTQDLVRAGMAEEEPIRVGGDTVAPIDVMVALLQHHRPRLMAEAGVTEPGGCLRVEVRGTKDGREHGYTFSLRSKGCQRPRRHEHRLRKRAPPHSRTHHSRRSRRVHPHDNRLRITP